MSNALYQSAKQAFLEGQIDYLTDNIKIALVANSYTGGSLALSNDTNYTAIASHVLSGVTSIVTLTNKSTSINGVLGIAAANTVTFSSITGNQVISYLVVFKDPDGTNINNAPSSNNQSSSQLIALFDSGYGIGAGTNGGSVQITWDATNGIFRL